VANSKRGGKPAGMQAWGDVDPGMAQQQAQALAGGSQHNKRSRWVSDLIFESKMV